MYYTVYVHVRAGLFELLSVFSQVFAGHWVSSGVSLYMYIFIIECVTSLWFATYIVNLSH